MINQRNKTIIFIVGSVIVLLGLGIFGFLFRSQISSFLSPTKTATISNRAVNTTASSRSSTRKCNQASGECKNSPALQTLLDCVLNTNNGGTNPNGLTQDITGSVFTYGGSHDSRSCHFSCTQNNERTPGAAAFDFGGWTNAPSFNTQMRQQIESAFEACSDPAHPITIRAEDAGTYCPNNDWTADAVTHIHGEFIGCGCPPPQHTGCQKQPPIDKEKPTKPPKPSPSDCSAPPTGANTHYGQVCDILFYNTNQQPYKLVSWRQTNVSQAACLMEHKPPQQKSQFTPVAILGTCQVLHFFEDVLLWEVENSPGATEQNCIYRAQKYEEKEKYYPAGTDFRTNWADKPVRSQCPANPPI